MKISPSLTDMFCLYNEIKNSVGLNLVTPEHLAAQSFDPQTMPASRRAELAETFKQHMIQGEALLGTLAENLTSSTATASLGMFSRPDLLRASQQIQAELAVAQQYLERIENYSI